MKKLELTQKEITELFNKSESKTRTTFNEIVKSVCEKYNMDVHSVLYSLGVA